MPIPESLLKAEDLTAWWRKSENYFKYFVGISGVKLQHGGNGYRAYQRYPSAGGSKGASGLEDMTADFFEKVLKGIKQDANMRATIGIGGAYSSLRDISQSYMGAKAALRHKFILGGNRVIHIKTDYNEKQNLLYPAEGKKC